MIIQKLIVTKFRKLNNFELELGNRITVISGHNGTMKSTILGLIMQPFDVEKESEKQKISSENFLTVHEKLPQSKFSDHFKFNYPDYDKPKGLQAEVFLHKGFSEESYPFETILRDKKSNSLRIWKKGDRSKGSGYIKEVPVIYHDLGRLYPLQNTNYATNSFEDFSNEEKKRFNTLYNNVFKSKRVEVNRAFPIDTKKYNKQSIGFISDRYDYKTLSSGEDSVCNIISSIISIERIVHRHKELNVDYKGSIVLIDEIDASLHPPIQKNLMNLLNKVSSRLKIQFIVTTHSLDIIEWAHSMRKFTMKDARTRKDIEIAYLVNHGNEVKLKSNPDLRQIANNLKMENGTKITLYVEDEEAAILLRNLLRPKILKELDIKPAHLGANVLIDILKPNGFITADDLIVCLDGDQNEKISKLKRKKVNIQNLISLPGLICPEEYLFNFVKAIPDDDDFWEDPLLTYINKDYILQNAPDEEKFRVHCKEKQTWFKTFHDLLESEGKITEFYELLASMRNAEINKFYDDINKALDHVKGNHLLTNRKKNIANNDINYDILGNKDIELVESMLSYAIDNRLEEFHPAYYPSEVYEKMTSTEKGFIYKLFKTLYVPKYCIESDEYYRFLMKF